MSARGHSVPRVFIDGTYAVGDVVSIGGGDARKIVSVLRCRTGDGAQLCDSTGRAFDAVLTVAGAKVEARLERIIARPVEAVREIILCQAIPKGAKMDFVVEKATELGASRIVAVITERTIGVASEGKVERWRRLARTAAAQCGRTLVPAVEGPLDWDALLDQLAAAGACIVLPWELAERVPLRDLLPSVLAHRGPVAVVIGPEGGISHDEAQRAVAAGAHAVSLGARILRTESAGLVLISALLYSLGEL